jgi:hypothetical protein
MNELKDKYKMNFGLVRTSMNKFDPCGLISSGAPFDEYDSLSNKILGLRHRKEPREKIKETILIELTDNFGEDINSLKEPYKTRFFQALDRFLDETENVE